MKLQSMIFSIFIVCSANVSVASISAFSRSNCYVPIAEIGWESITWGWPESIRSTSSWHLKNGQHPNTAHNLVDYFRETWRSFAGDSHGLSAGWENQWEVRGKHWWQATVPFNGTYFYKGSSATNCNLNQW